MKTNHARQFTARQDFKPGHRMIHNQAFKLASNQGFRTANRRILNSLRKGADPDETIFLFTDEVEDKWGWD